MVNGWNIWILNSFISKVASYSLVYAFSNPNSGRAYHNKSHFYIDRIFEIEQTLVLFYHNTNTFDLSIFVQTTVYE